jgi:hypothetical protein
MDGVGNNLKITDSEQNSRHIAEYDDISNDALFMPLSKPQLTTYSGQILQSSLDMAQLL